jgi:hypothetical protein
MRGRNRSILRGYYRFNGPISPPSIPGIYRNPLPGKNNNVPWIESSDRRLRDTETLLIAFDKARSGKIDKMGFKRIPLHMPTSGDRKQEKSDFLANGEMFFLDLLSHRRPQQPAVSLYF